MSSVYIIECHCLMTIKRMSLKVLIIFTCHPSKFTVNLTCQSENRAVLIKKNLLNCYRLFVLKSFPISRYLVRYVFFIFYRKVGFFLKKQLNVEKYSVPCVQVTIDGIGWLVGLMVLNATFNNISVIL